MSDFLGWLMFGGVIVAFAAAVFGTLLGYVFLRKRYPHRKLLNEILICGIALLISGVARYIAVMNLDPIIFDPDSVWKVSAICMSVIYSLFGGVAFEGSFALNEFSTALNAMLFYGAITYVGIVFLIIVSIRISYEWYSYVKLLGFQRKFDRYYVFTDVSEASMLVARQIHREERTRKQGKYVIVFTGDELEPLDKSSDVYRTIVDHGFYYWSYPKKLNKTKEHSLLKKLGCTKKHFGKCDSLDDKHLDYNKRVHIFAMREDGELRGLENENSDIVFDDIRAVLRDFCGKTGEGIPTVINYYLLTRNDTDYEHYQRKLDGVVSRFAKRQGMVEAFETEYKKYLQLHLLNEAKLMADDLLAATQKDFFRNAEEFAENYPAYQRCMGLDKGTDTYRVAVMGFGKVGQYAMKELFVHSASLKENGRDATQFIADVYDADALSHSGEFAYAHPFFLCKTKETQEPLPDHKLVEWARAQRSCALNMLYNSKQQHLEPEKKLTTERIFDGMGFPIVHFHEVSCFKKCFMYRMDESMDAAEESMNIDSDKVDYRAYVVSLGNDESNLAMANLLIDDLKHGLLSLPKTELAARPLKTVFVHIRDKRNVDRLSWTAADKTALGECLRVVSFGCDRSIWEYSDLIDDEDDCLFYYVYNEVSNSSKTKQRDIYEKLASLGSNYIEKIKAGTAHKDGWRSETPFKKQSNRSVRRYALNYHPCGEQPTWTEDEYQILEHLRWNRFYMANGWIYVEEYARGKDYHRENREHDCLCPFEMVSVGTKKFDTYNVMIGKNKLFL